MTRRSRAAATPARAAAVRTALAAAYPEATCELAFSNAYELLVATILSAQCTDARVNMVTPALFRRFPDARALAAADQAELEELIRTTGFFRNKAKSLLGMARAVVERHGGEVPAAMERLTELPGVGRKTANVVLGTAFGLATGVVVDTHVARLAGRLGLSRETDPERIERDLMELFPKKEWVALGHRLILHGRRVCHARKPACDACALAETCPRVGV
ncbi:MAG TPA: endonuclease III [Thermoanaerobaculaceae bacterium]|nr:endonuclease III [Thermoanaerobaculaceae bacterium]